MLIIALQAEEKQLLVKDEIKTRKPAQRVGLQLYLSIFFLYPILCISKHIYDVDFT